MTEINEHRRNGADGMARHGRAAYVSRLAVAEAGDEGYECPGLVPGPCLGPGTGPGTGAGSLVMGSLMDFSRSLNGKGRPVGPPFAFCLATGFLEVHAAT
jgi:hypothetical protein